MVFPPLIITIFSFIFGITIGSFLNVVIYRVPMNMSVVAPASRCPVCGAGIRAYDNIPLISWLLLLGLCRDCGARISARYFFVELLTGVITMIVVVKYGLRFETIAYLMMAWGLVAITFIDLDFQIIPDEISVGGVIAGLAISWFMPVGVEGAIVGMLTGGGIFFTLALLYPGGMGGGDIKLMAAIGAFLGWQLALLTIMIASVFGSIVGIGAMIAFGKKRKDRIPFGPFLAFGGLIAMVWGWDIVFLYLNTFI